jgi:WD40 repeat protein
LKKEYLEPIYKMEHQGAVSSAHFSRKTGSKILTCSADHNIRLLNISNGAFDSNSTLQIPHDNRVGRWTTSLKAIFDPKHEDCFIVGNKKRAIDVFSSAYAEYTVILRHELLTTIPAVNCIHPYLPLWISGNSRGYVYVWQ